MSMPQDAHSLFRPAPGTRPTPITLDKSQLRWQRGDCLFIWFSLNTYFGFLRSASVTRHVYPSAHIMVNVIGAFLAWIEFHMPSRVSIRYVSGRVDLLEHIDFSKLATRCYGSGSQSNRFAGNQSRDTYRAVD